MSVTATQVSDEVLNARLIAAKTPTDGVIDLVAVVAAMPKCGTKRPCESGRIHGKFCPLRWGDCGYQNETGETQDRS